MSTIPQPGDKLLICKSCGCRFAFGVGEQYFFAGNGWGDPVRCLDCRRAAKAALVGFEDTRRQCQACGLEFRWPAAEQASFARRGWTPPRMCVPCRGKARGDQP